MPKLTDDRYADGQKAAVSVLFREGFVTAFADQLKSPVWVAQRWSRENFKDKIDTPSVGRDFVNDGDIPPAFHIGTSYAGNTTLLDRGHMAKHSMNRAWGFDSSIAGCLMTNITPQHKGINREPGAWWNLEDTVEKAIIDDNIGIPLLWTISGAVFQDQTNAPNENPRDDIQKAASITTGFKVPYATYKIVCCSRPTGNSTPVATCSNSLTPTLGEIRSSRYRTRASP